MASSPASPGTSYTIVFLVDPKRRHPLSNGCYKRRFLILEFQVMRKSKGFIYCTGRSPPPFSCSASPAICPSGWGPWSSPGAPSSLARTTPFISPTCVLQVLLGTLVVGAPGPMFRKGLWWLIESLPISSGVSLRGQLTHESQL